MRVRRILNTDPHKFALLISALMSAPLITLGTFLPIIYKFENDDVWLLMGITSFFGCFLPMGMVFVFLTKNYITDLYATDKSERFIPFLTTILSYLLGMFTLLLVKAPAQITALMACYLGNGIVLALITLKWKISIHSSGITGPITALVYLLGTKLLPLYFLVIPVIWARLELKAHSMLQLTIGALLTIFLTWFQMKYYLTSVFI